MTTGSYDFESFRDQPFQAERLRQQARAVRGIEATILRSAGLQAQHDVLELGCGPGYVTDLLAELAPQGTLHAVDPSPALVAQVAGNVKQPPQGGLFVHQAFGDALPLSDGTVDFGYVRFVLQHLAQPAPVLSEVHRVLRTGGRLCLVDSDDGLVVCHPEHDRVNRLMEAARAAQASQGGDRLVGRKLHAMLHEAGFIQVKTRILALTSSELPFDTLFNILLGYKAALLGDIIDLKALRDELADAVASGRQLLAGGVFIVAGEKA